MEKEARRGGESHPTDRERMSCDHRAEAACRGKRGPVDFPADTAGDVTSRAFFPAYRLELTRTIFFPLVIDRLISCFSNNLKNIFATDKF